MSEPGSFTREKDAEGVLVLTLDVPGERVNTLSRGMMAEFESMLDELGKDDSVRAVGFDQARGEGRIVERSRADDGS